jgi:hypothetical protein
VTATTAPDTTVPTAPATLTATAISASRIDLAWSASTDPDGVSGYRIFRGGVEIATVTSGLGYSDTSVVPSTTYSYTVRAFDSVNESPNSPVATATTPAASGNPIKHVVVIYQENNSFDEVLGYTCAVTLAGRCDGATTGKTSTGTTIPLAQPPDIVPTVNHSPGSITTAIDGGKMDGFDKNSGCTSSTGYACYVSYRPSQIPNLAMYAEQYVVADRTFESKVSASWGRPPWTGSRASTRLTPSLRPRAGAATPAPPPRGSRRAAGRHQTSRHASRTTRSTPPSFRTAAPSRRPPSRTCRRSWTP